MLTAKICGLREGFTHPEYRPFFYFPDCFISNESDEREDAMERCGFTVEDLVASTVLHDVLFFRLETILEFVFSLLVCHLFK